MLVNAIENNAWSLAEMIFQKIIKLDTDQKQARVSGICRLYYYIKTHQIELANAEWESFTGGSRKHPSHGRER